MTPLILDFGPIGIGSTSPTQSVTITNLGTATLADFAGGGVHPPFSATQDCGAGVPPGASCQYTFHFSPTSAGRYAATSSSSTNAGPVSITLYGGEMIRGYLPRIRR